MGCEVYANGNAISCKAGDNKVIAAFPDVCLSPPSPPAGPIPLPYPNTSFSKDMKNGSKTVKISDKEVMLKDSSYFSTSTGDEAGCAPKKGVITSKIKGKVYFNSWSMDVKIEGQNAVRHLDVTTHNHASKIGQTPPWPFVDAMATGDDPCKKEKKKVQKHCSPEKDAPGPPPVKGWQRHCPPNPPTAPHHATGGKAPDKPKKGATQAQKDEYATYQQLQNEFIIAQQEFRKKVDENPCLRARRCMLVPKEQKVKSGPKGECCPGQTPHHVVDGASFTEPPGTPNAGSNSPAWKNYDYNAAPCVCCEGFNQTTGSHGEIHLRTGVQCQDQSQSGSWTMKQAKTAGTRAVRKTFPGSGCSQKCLEAQLTKGHEGCEDPKGSDPPLRATAQDEMSAEPMFQAQARLDMQ